MEKWSPFCVWEVFFKSLLNIKMLEYQVKSPYIHLFMLTGSNTTVIIFDNIIYKKSQSP